VYGPVTLSDGFGLADLLVEDQDPAELDTLDNESSGKFSAFILARISSAFSFIFLTGDFSNFPY
jgi:hypothetical protein